MNELNNILIFLPLIGYLTLIAIVSGIGHRKEIGFTTSFMLSLFLTPVIGLVAVSVSEKKQFKVQNATNK